MTEKARISTTCIIKFPCRAVRLLSTFPYVKAKVKSGLALGSPNQVHTHAARAAAKQLNKQPSQARTSGDRARRALVRVSPGLSHGRRRGSRAHNNVKQSMGTSALLLKQRSRSDGNVERSRAARQCRNVCLFAKRCLARPRPCVRVRVLPSSNAKAKSSRRVET